MKCSRFIQILNEVIVNGLIFFEINGKWSKWINCWQHENEILVQILPEFSFTKNNFSV